MSRRLAWRPAQWVAEPPDAAAVGNGPSRDTAAAMSANRSKSMDEIIVGQRRTARINIDLKISLAVAILVA